jgi:hypothetical protein
VRGEEVLIAIRRNSIRILEKKPKSNERVVVYSALQKRYFLPDFSVIADKVFLKGGRDY